MEYVVVNTSGIKHGAASIWFRDFRTIFDHRRGLTLNIPDISGIVITGMERNILYERTNDSCEL